MLVIWLVSYISLMVYLLYNDFDEKNVKIFRSLGVIMILFVFFFMIFVTMSSIISSLFGQLEVNYTILLFGLFFTFIIIYWFIKVTNFLE